MTDFRADFYPDGLEPDAPLEPLSTPGWPPRRRALTPPVADHLARGLRERASQLRLLPSREIIRTLARVHREWAEPSSALRASAVERLTVLTGYPAPVVDRSLRSLFRSMGAPEMETWLAEGGVTPEMLDGAPRALRHGVSTLAFGPRVTLVVSAGNIPAAAIPSLVQALLLKSACLVKTSSSEPLLLPMYARSLAEREPAVAEAIAVTGWEGGRADIEDAVLSHVDAAVVYGSNRAVTDYRSRVPGHARFIGYGHRISFSVVGREWLTSDRASRTAREAARDLVLFDQQGCLSPQAVYVERGGTVTPEEFAGLMAEALASYERRLPRRPLDAAEAAAIHQYRAAVEMRALVEPGVRLWSSPGGTQWNVVLENSSELQPCPLHRTAVIRPAVDLEQLPGLLSVHAGDLISGALGTSEERRMSLAVILGEAGVTRITTLGRAQEPRTALHHDGVNAIGALARFVTIEDGPGERVSG